MPKKQEPLPGPRYYRYYRYYTYYRYYRYYTYYRYHTYYRYYKYYRYYTYYTGTECILCIPHYMVHHMSPVHNMSSYMTYLPERR